jgi:hypothetical protein
MKALLLLASLFAFTASEAIDAKTKMYLNLDEARDLMMEPYKLYEIYVPTNKLKVNE